MPDEFKFKIGDNVQTNELFKTEYKYEIPFRGIVTYIQYATVLGEKVPYIDVDHRKSINQKYLELSKYESPYDDPEFQVVMEKLNKQNDIAISRYNKAKAELKTAEADLKNIEKNIVLFKESYGIYQNVR